MERIALTPLAVAVDATIVGSVVVGVVGYLYLKDADENGGSIDPPFPKIRK